VEETCQHNARRGRYVSRDPCLAPSRRKQPALLCRVRRRCFPVHDPPIPNTILSVPSSLLSSALAHSNTSLSHPSICTRLHSRRPSGITTTCTPHIIPNITIVRRVKILKEWNFQAMAPTTRCFSRPRIRNGHHRRLLWLTDNLRSVLKFSDNPTKQIRSPVGIPKNHLAPRAKILSTALRKQLLRR